MDRRQVLVSVGTALGVSLTGCAAVSESVDSSEVRLVNSLDETVTGTVHIAKFADDADEADRHETQPEPPTDPDWSRSWEFTVDPGDSKTNGDLGIEPGAFYVEVGCERGATAAREAGLYSGGPDGETVAGGQIVVRLREPNDDSDSISIGQDVAD